MRRRDGLCWLFFALASVMMAEAQDAVQPRPALHVQAFGVKHVQDCGRQLLALSAELQTLHFPEGWTIAVACTPVAWNESLRRAEYPPTASAFTSLRARITVLNGAIFAGWRSEYRRSIAHELAHVICHCANEARVNEIAGRLEHEDAAAGSDNRKAAAEIAGGQK